MHVPDLADLEALRAQAEAVLKPEPGQRVLIVVVTDEEAETMFEEPKIDERDNVLSMHGGPVLTGEEARQADRAETADLLLEYAAAAERGEIRHVALVVGCETNERFMGHVQTAMSRGLEDDHLALFLGGATLLANHIQDVFEQAAEGIEEEN